MLHEYIPLIKPNEYLPVMLEEITAKSTLP